jgi:hypothetical protein
MVADAVEKQTFWVLPHPELLEQHMRDQAEAMFADRSLPPLRMI